MSLVITGESGDLGDALLSRAQQAGVPVRVVLPEWAADSSPQEAGHRLQDPESEIAAVLGRLRPRVVIHFPWRGSGTGRSVRRRRLNVEATLATAVAAEDAGAERFVYWGSVRAYSRARVPGLPMEPLSESAPMVSSGPGADLAAADRGLRDWAKGSSRPSLLLFRAATVLRDGAEGSRAQLVGLRLLPRPAHSVALQFLHPQDALAILWRAATDAVPGVYNVASDEVLLSRELARGIGALSVSLPTPAAWLLLASQVGPAAATRMLPPLYCPLVVDNGRLKTHFGYRPRYSARQALALALQD